MLKINTFGHVSIHLLRDIITTNDAVSTASHESLMLVLGNLKRVHMSLGQRVLSGDALLEEVKHLQEKYKHVINISEGK